MTSENSGHFTFLGVRNGPFENGADKQWNEAEQKSVDGLDIGRADAGVEWRCEQTMLFGQRMLV
jgi:hypothetical protein